MAEKRYQQRRRKQKVDQAAVDASARCPIDVVSLHASMQYSRMEAYAANSMHENIANILRDARSAGCSHVEGHTYRPSASALRSLNLFAVIRPQPQQLVHLLACASMCSIRIQHELVRPCIDSFLSSRKRSDPSQTSDWGRRVSRQNPIPKAGSSGR